MPTHKRRTWEFPWRYRESFIICIGLIVCGIALQYATGRNIAIPSFPSNLFFLAAMLVIISILHIRRHKSHIVQWMSSAPAAIVCIGSLTILALLMGFVPQNDTITGGTGIFNIKHSWMFAFVEIFTLVCLALVILRRLLLKRKRISFLLNHFGLWLVLVAASFGSGDFEKYRMAVYENDVNWVGVCSNGENVELPIAIALNDFSIDYYPVEFTVYDIENEKVLKNSLFTIQDDSSFTFDSYTFYIQNYVQYAWKMGDVYRNAMAPGSAPAALISCINDKNDTVAGWVTCGSVLQPTESLPFSNKYMLIMPERRPALFESDVTIYSKDGQVHDDVISVNNPFTINGYKIYQSSYDEVAGEYSEYSIFEIIKDPWLPIVYAGLIILMIGAVFMFIGGIDSKYAKNE